MKKLFATVLSVAVAMSLSPALASAQSTSCPAEVAQAKAMLSKKQVASINSQDVQAPRSLAGAQAGGGITKAAQLVKDAEAACKAGDTKAAKDKAIEALAILK